MYIMNSNSCLIQDTVTIILAIISNSSLDVSKETEFKNAVTCLSLNKYVNKICYIKCIWKEISVIWA